MMLFDAVQHKNAVSTKTRGTTMELIDMLGSDVLREMAYTQKKAERVITSLERPINDNLLRLWTSVEAQDHKSCIDEIVDLIDEVSEIVRRPTNKRPSHLFYYKLLFFEPFGGGSAVSNTLRRLRRLHRQGYPIQVDASPDDLVERLQAFHRDLAGRCASKSMGEHQIRTFLNEH
jgi:hypothetical protein